MGRNHNPLTGTQLNKAKFDRLTTQIKGYGIRKLASYGLVSHTTITRFCNKLAVGEGTEDNIRESIRLHQLKLEAERKRSESEALRSPKKCWPINKSTKKTTEESIFRFV